MSFEIVIFILKGGIITAAAVMSIEFFSLRKKTRILHG